MRKTSKRIFFIIISILLVVITNSMFLIAATEYEDVIINGKTISHYNVGGVVKMPTTYVVDSAEMRGAWVTTVWNEDMPKQKDASEKSINEYKAVYLDVLDTLEKYNMNTIFFQIRPANDAFYRSELNDWSKYLVGPGVDPGWDPMEWMIEEAHKRNIYFMGWMNAFRVTPEEWFTDNAINHSVDEIIAKKSEAIQSLSSKNFAKLHPECVLMGDYDSKLFLNPGDPVVHEHIVNSLREIAVNYDIDGFHFDDYFYPSSRQADMNSQEYNLCFAGGVSYDERLTGANITNDLPTYLDYQSDNEKYGLEAGLKLGEFRRQSINNLMRKIREMVDDVNATYNKHVEYGSKPAAVWQSNYEYCHDRRTAVGGSNTHCGAYSSNYDLFADTKYWVEQGYVDWIAPQVYFDFSNSEVPYADIVSWWANVVTRVNEQRAAEGKKPIRMYVAHGIYKYHKSDTEYNDSNEMVYQVRYNKLFPVIKGDAVYAYSDLAVFKNTVHQQGIGVKLYVLWKTNKVLPIALDPLDNDELQVGDITVKEATNKNTYRIIIENDPNISMYAVYRVNKGEALNLNDTTKRIDIVKTYHQNLDYNLYMVSNYDYYLQPISNNYYPSKFAKQIDPSLLKPNSAPEAVNIVIGSGEANLPNNEVIQMHIPYAVDADNDELSYKLSISLNGEAGPFNINCDSVEYLDNEILATFEPFGSYVESFMLKVEISDNLTKTTCYSQPVSLGVKPGTNDGGGGETPEPPAKQNSGCSFGVQIAGILGLLCLSSIIIKKKHY